MSYERKLCPNPECEDGDPQSEYTGRWVWCGCQTCDTRAARVEVEGDSAADWDAATTEARRLWDALPRDAGPEAATRPLLEAMRAAIDGWEELDYLCFNHEHGFGETVDRSTVVDALRENGMEAGS